MAQQSSSSLRRRAIVLGLLVAFVLLGMALRFYRLDATSLWLDEILTAKVSELDLPSMLRDTASGKGGKTRLPLSFGITHALTYVAGDGEFGLRLQAALFGTLSILLAYKLGKDIHSDEVGLVGAFLLAINSYHIAYSQEARYYSLMVFLGLPSLILLLKALRENAVGPWIGFVLCSILGLYNHYFAFLLLAAQVLFALLIIAGDWLSHRRQDRAASAISRGDQLSRPARHLVMLGVSVLVIGLAFAPWVRALQAVLSRQLSSGAIVLSLDRVTLPLDLLQTAIRQYSDTAGASPVLLLLWAALFLLGLAATDRKWIALLLLCILVPLVFAFGVVPKHPFRPKYVLYVLPLYLLTVARGVTAIADLLQLRLPRLRSNPNWRLALPLALTIPLFGWLSLQPVTRYYGREQTDWRSLAKYLEPRANPSDIILAEGDGYGMPDHLRVERCLPYYLERSGLEGMQIVPVTRRLAATLQTEATAERGRLWAVVYHLHRGLPQDKAADVKVSSFRHLTAITLQDPSGDHQEDAIALLLHLRNLLRMPEAHFEVHLALVELYASMSDEAAALAQLEMASAVKPDRSNACLALANALRENGRLEEAIPEYERALVLAPRRVRPYLGLGEAYERLGQQQQAREVYEDLLAVKPSSIRAQQRLARLP